MQNGPKRSSNKVVTKRPKPLSIEAYKKVVDELADKVDSVTPCLVNAQDKYNLGLVYHVTDDSMAYPFDKFVDMFFNQKTEVYLGIQFESKKPLVTWLLVKNEFIT